MKGERIDILKGRALKIVNKVERDNFELDEETAKEMELALSRKNKS
jgi:hypothetical protein